MVNQPTVGTVQSRLTSDANTWEVAVLLQSLIEQFWDKVGAILEEDRTLPEDQWRKAVSKFRHWVEPKVGEMIYNRNAEDVATTISKAVTEGGFLDRDLVYFD